MNKIKNLIKIVKKPNLIIIKMVYKYMDHSN